MYERDRAATKREKQRDSERERERKRSVAAKIVFTSIEEQVKQRNSERTIYNESHASTRTNH
jgi:hypothetical protein